MWRFVAAGYCPGVYARGRGCIIVGFRAAAVIMWDFSDFKTFRVLRLKLRDLYPYIIVLNTNFAVASSLIPRLFKY